MHVFRFNLERAYYSENTLPQIFFIALSPFINDCINLDREKIKIQRLLQQQIRPLAQQ